MRIEVKIDTTCSEPKVVIVTDKMTDEINDVLKKLSETAPDIIVGFRADTAEPMVQSQIYRIVASEGKVYAVTDEGEYQLRLRLYELENRLDKGSFVRISNSEIINLKRVKGFDLSLAGTICVRLTNGMVTYVSRRYVARIKQVLGI